MVLARYSFSVAVATKQKLRHVDTNSKIGGW
jgi:hypothetical protein